MTYYLMNQRRHENFTALSFGVMYALSNFTIAYYENMMWFDCVMLLPLIALAIEKLVRYDKGVFYCIILFFAVYSNYYIGYMICLFSVLFFLLQCVIVKVKGPKQFFKKSAVFSIYSMISVGMASFILLPAIKALSITKTSRDMGLFFTKETYSSIINQLSNHFFMSKPVTITGYQGDLNIYCGVGVMFFILLFMINKRIPLRKRIGEILLAVILFLGFHIKTLNLIFHGFHSPVGFPNRFAFIYIFMVLLMSYEAVCRIKKYSTKELAACIAIAIGFVFFAGTWSKVSSACLLLTAGFLIIIFLNCFLYNKSKFNKKVFVIVLFILAVIETGSNAVSGLMQDGSADRNYAKHENMQEIIGEDDSFYRMDILNPSLLDENTLYGVKGIAQFSSMVPAYMQNLLKKLGFQVEINKYKYAGATDITNMLLGIKYTAISGSSKYSNWPLKGQLDKLNVYENPYYLGLGFATNSDILTWNINKNNPFEVQDDLLYKMTGQKIFKTRTAYVYPEIQTFSIDVKAGEHTYFYIDSFAYEAISIDGTNYTKDLNRIFDLGVSDTDKSITVGFVPSLGAQLDMKIKYYIGSFSTGKLQNIYEQLNEQRFVINNYSDSIIEGVVNSKNSDILFTSIPYDKGWTAYVDGKKTDIVKIGDAVIGIPLTLGVHNIKLSYKTDGLYSGLFMSLFSLCLFLILAYLEKRKKPYKNKKLPF